MCYSLSLELQIAAWKRQSGRPHRKSLPRSLWDWLSSSKVPGGGTADGGLTLLEEEEDILPGSPGVSLVSTHSGMSDSSSAPPACTCAVGEPGTPGSWLLFWVGERWEGFAGAARLQPCKCFASLVG